MSPGENSTFLWSPHTRGSQKSRGSNINPSGKALWEIYCRCNLKRWHCVLRQWICVQEKTTALNDGCEDDLFLLLFTVTNKTKQTHCTPTFSLADIKSKIFSKSQTFLKWTLLNSISQDVDSTTPTKGPHELTSDERSYKDDTHKDRVTRCHFFFVFFFFKV